MCHREDAFIFLGTKGRWWLFRLLGDGFQEHLVRGFIDTRDHSGGHFRNSMGHLEGAFRDKWAI